VVKVVRYVLGRDLEAVRKSFFGIYISAPFHLLLSGRKNLYLHL